MRYIYNKYGKLVWRAGIRFPITFSHSLPTYGSGCDKGLQKLRVGFAGADALA